MARKNGLWFEFAGVSSTAKGLKLLALPDRPRAALRVPDEPPIPGRDGTLWLPEDAYDDIEISVRAQLLSTVTPASISAWLTGRGWLRFSDAPTRAYKARALAAYPYAHIGGCETRQTIEVTFTCHPCAYVYPIPSVALTNGRIITNPGTRYAEPVITIVGSGDITLAIGTQTLVITGLTGGSITLDMEARVAFRELTDGSKVNLCPLVSGDWPLLIQPGSNAVSWTGAVSALTLDAANWRYV